LHPVISAIVNHELPLIFTKVLHFNLCSFVLIRGFIFGVGADIFPQIIAGYRVKASKK